MSNSPASSPRASISSDRSTGTSSSHSRSKSNSNSIVTNRSKLREFLASIATIRGDLSNITAPPFVLDTKSAAELPAFWAERPSVFVAPALPPPPAFAETNAPAEALRALLVLRWFLSALRGQQYAGRRPEDGVKKPLNAFLGEVFVARWEDECGLTRLVSEQVSHHPPVTACRVWNGEHGVYAEGFTRQEITFNGNVNIQQIGHATLTLPKHNDETYLIPLPSVKVKGILSGTPYPELGGTYQIPSTNGYMSTIDFSGKGFFSLGDEKKHGVKARLYKEGDEENPLFTVSGHWDSEFVIHDVARGQDVEIFDVSAIRPTPLQTDALEDQDPWETRRAWRGVREALERGDMQGTSDAKSLVEQGQRQMRKDEQREGRKWESVFYRAVQSDEVAEILAAKIGKQVVPQQTVALWKFDTEKFVKEDGLKKPWHGDLTPDNSGVGQRAEKKESEVDGVAVSMNSVDGRGSLDGRKSLDERKSLDGRKSISWRRSLDSGKTEPNSVAKSTSIVNPPLSPEAQQREVDRDKALDSGIKGMTLQERMAVEDMLRDQYSSFGRRRRS